MLRRLNQEVARVVALPDVRQHSSGLRRYKIIPWWVNEGSTQLTAKLASKQVILG